MAGTLWKMSVQLRPSDIDYLGHVTAAAYLAFFEEARVRWLSEAWKDSRPTYVVAQQRLDYRRELRLDDDEVTVQIGLTRLGRSGFDVFETLSARDALKAESTATLVAWDSERRSSRPLSEEERQALACHLPDYG